MVQGAWLWPRRSWVRIPSLTPPEASNHRAPVAQRIEHWASDPGVAGSNPVGRATSNRGYGAAVSALDYATIPFQTATHYRPAMHDVREGAPMSSIDDFVNHRWADTKEALRNIDPDYVNRNEQTAQIQRIGLEPPWPVDPNRRPRLRLSREWHLVLESCAELVLQVTCLQIAAEGLSAKGNMGVPSLEAGKRQAYHHRSWFIHAKTLTERAVYVIEQTSQMYVTDSSLAKELTKRHKGHIYEQITQRVDAQRNEHAHGTTRSWSKGITEDQLWELSVSIGMSPSLYLDQFFHSPQGESTIRGKYDFYLPLTNCILDGLGKILYDFEQDLMTNYKLKYLMGRRG